MFIQHFLHDSHTVVALPLYSKPVAVTCEELLRVLRIDNSIVLCLYISCDLPATSENICEQHVFSCETVCDVAASECSMSVICIRNCLQ